MCCYFVQCIKYFVNWLTENICKVLWFKAYKTDTLHIFTEYNHNHTHTAYTYRELYNKHRWLILWTFENIYNHLIQIASKDFHSLHWIKYIFYNYTSIFLFHELMEKIQNNFNLKFSRKTVSHIWDLITWCTKFTNNYFNHMHTK